MLPEGYHAIAVGDETFDRSTEVMIEYHCGSVADAVAKSAAIALETVEAALAQLLADRLAG
jgi:hypothetical protein